MVHRHPKYFLKLGYYFGWVLTILLALVSAQDIHAGRQTPEESREKLPELADWSHMRLADAGILDAPDVYAPTLIKMYAARRQLDADYIPNRLTPEKKRELEKIVYSYGRMYKQEPTPEPSQAPTVGFNPEPFSSEPSEYLKEPQDPFRWIMYAVLGITIL